MRKRTKFFLLRVSIIALFAILAGRLWYVQVVMSSYYTAQGDTSKIREVPVQALRGIIYDSQGRQLVYNAPSWQVEIVPHGVPSSQAAHIYAMLSGLLHGAPTAARIAQIVRQNFFQPYVGALVKDHVGTDAAMIIKQLHPQLPGVRVEPTSARNYVLDTGLDLSHILGYTVEIGDQYKQDRRLYPAEHVDPTDQTGAAGVEASMDAYLHGVNGRERVEVDAGERPVRVLKQAQTIPGDDIYLTLNWRLQQQWSADLAAGLQHLHLTKGIAILEDVHSGKILAMVSQPGYNNNWFAGGISQKRYNQLISNPAQPLFDLSTQGQFPPGSTYKVITATAALQTGVVNAATTYDDTGSIKLCGQYDASACTTFNGWKPGGLGSVNVVSALAESSDIYFYTVAGGNPNLNPPPPHTGATRLAKYARLYGLGAKTGIELPGESTGFVPTPFWYQHLSNPAIKTPGDTWHIGHTYNSAIGQGFDSATPLQMVNVVATIANGGTVYRPRIVDRIMGRVVPRQGALPTVGTIQPFVPSPIRTGFIDPINLALIQQGMHQSVTPISQGGTSYAVVDNRINAAGKTGTAETGNGRPPHAWWIGYAPFNHPQVAIVVLVPYAGGEGAYVAAPIAHKLLEDYFHLPARPGEWLDNPLFCTCLVPGSGGGAQ